MMTLQQLPPIRAPRPTGRIPAILSAITLLLISITSAPASAQAASTVPGRVTVVQVAATTGWWHPPVPGGKIQVIRPFTKPVQRWSPGHRGVDLVTDSANAPVLAPAEGTVVFAGKVVDRTVMVLEHPGGLRSSFEPVTDPLPVGTQVAAGDKIATLDPHLHHCTQSPCLHWGVRRGGDHNNGSGKNAEYINPLTLLGPQQPSILLPVDESFSA